MRNYNRLLSLVGLAALALLLAGCSGQMTNEPNSMKIGVELSQPNQQQAVSSSIQILLLMTALSLAPAVLTMLTAFTRIVIVLSFVRTALSTPQLPPSQVLIGLSLFLTVFVMAPTWNKINQDALQPYMAGEITQEKAAEVSLGYERDFLFKQTRERDIALFVNLAKLPRPQTPNDVPTYVLIPAFIISELKTAFQMGLIIFVPFLIIDMVVASALMAMGMMMLPPSLISLPFKLLLFVMVDGWHLIIRSLIISFGS